jgi:hypothetical protein
MDIRLPIEPLIDYCCANQADSNSYNIGPVGITAKRLNIHRTYLYRWIKTGITPYQADRLAIKQLGVHPAQIWSTWHHHA